MDWKGCLGEVIDSIRKISPLPMDSTKENRILRIYQNFLTIFFNLKKFVNIEILKKYFKNHLFKALKPATLKANKHLEISKDENN